jgi:hypothetical protein
MRHKTIYLESVLDSGMRPLGYYVSYRRGKRMMGAKITAKERIADRLKYHDVAEYPTFLAIASWFALHNCYTCQKPMEEVVNPADVIQDGSYEDTNHLFGFRGDTQGAHALKTLRGLVECEVFLHDGKGSYVEADEEFLADLELENKGIDVRDSKALGDFLKNFFENPLLRRDLGLKP